MTLENHKGWMPNDVEYDNPAEIAIIEYCRLYLNGFYFLPKEKDYNPDIRVFDEDDGIYICNIEVEAKKESFDEYPTPPHYWPYWSFLGRKITNMDFADSDIYLICEENLSPRIFAWPFGRIRKYENLIKYVRIPNNRNEIYYRIPIKEISIWNKWKDIKNYLQLLKENDSYIKNTYL